MRKILFVFFMVLQAAVLRAQAVIAINEKGEQLKRFYAHLNVEHLWLAGHHIDWESGLPDRPEAEQGIKTHCSAFVAAACKQRQIYILRPPQHGQVLLANAQYNWLQTNDAKAMGWHLIVTTDISSTYVLAQAYANKGFIVIAIYLNQNNKKPGHIALVMPTEISPENLSANGPSVIMAGTHNYNSISLKEGFKSHISAWPDPAILFYYNGEN